MKVSGISADIMSAGQFLDLIAQGRVGLPDFQRNFEWTVSDVRAYLSTVVAGFPSGTLMVAENESLGVSLRALEGAPALDGEYKNTLVILDGQQRLTALFHALFELGPERYYVDFTALSEGVDILEDSVVLAFPSLRSHLRIKDAEDEGRVLVPFSVLADSSSFFSWLSDPERNRSTLLPDDELGQIFAARIRPVRQYAMPTTTVGGDLSVATVARIFERINKSGVRLDAFDLLVARLQVGNWNLRSAWDSALESYPQISRVFSANGIIPMTSLSLSVNGDVRRNSVLDLDYRVVSRKWDDLVRAIADIADLLIGLGVRRPELLPHDGIATVAIAGLMSGLPRGTIESYFWRAGSSRRYDAASNTRVASDFRALVDGVQIDVIFDDWVPDLESIERSTRRSSRALWATLIALMLHEGPKDLSNGVLLSEPVVNDRELWFLHSIAKGGRLYETEADTPYRLRTAGQYFSASRRHRSLTGLIEDRVLNPTFDYLPSIDDCLRSQLLPPVEFFHDKPTLPSLIRFRSDLLLKHLRFNAG